MTVEHATDSTAARLPEPSIDPPDATPMRPKHNVSSSKGRKKPAAAHYHKRGACRRAVDPTPEEIEMRCIQIRCDWDDRTEKMRRTEDVSWKVPQTRKSCGGEWKGEAAE